MNFTIVSSEFRPAVRLHPENEPCRGTTVHIKPPVITEQSQSPDSKIML